MMDMVKQAIGIIDSFEEANHTMLDRLSINLQEDIACIISMLGTSCYMATYNAIRLLENRQIWGALILLRTVIHGTAKFCYLLSSDDEDIRNDRLRKYTDMASKREYGSMYHRICGMLKKGLFGEKGNFVEERIKAPTCDMMVTEETAEVVKEHVGLAVKQLEYLELSAVLKQELEFWELMYLVFDYEYSVANSFVHLNYNATCEITHLQSMSEPDRCATVCAQVSNKLLMLCALQRARCEVLFKRAGAPTDEMRRIMTVDSPFISMVDELCLAESNRMTNADKTWH